MVSLMAIAELHQFEATIAGLSRPGVMLELARALERVETEGTPDDGAARAASSVVAGDDKWVPVVPRVVDQQLMALPDSCRRAVAQCIIGPLTREPTSAGLDLPVLPGVRVLPAGRHRIWFRVDPRGRRVLVLGIEER